MTDPEMVTVPRSAWNLNQRYARTGFILLILGCLLGASTTAFLARVLATQPPCQLLPPDTPAKAH